MLQKEGMVIVHQWFHIYPQGRRYMGVLVKSLRLSFEAGISEIDGDFTLIYMFTFEGCYNGYSLQCVNKKIIK